MIPNRHLPSIITYCLLGAAAAVSFLLPDTLTVAPTLAAGTPNGITLIGVVYDFRESHPDFQIVPASGYGHFAGNVETTLGSDRVPTFVGVGSADFSGAAPVAAPRRSRGPSASSRFSPRRAAMWSSGRLRCKRSFRRRSR